MPRFGRRRLAIFLVSALIIALPWMLPQPEGLSAEGFRALAIFVVCVLWWITNVVPLMITSLLAIVAFPVLGIAESDEVYALFGNRAVFFILGSFIIAAAFIQSGLCTRVSCLFLRHFGRSSRLLALSMLLLGFILAFWTSGHAVAAMLMPIVMEISGSLLDQPQGTKMASCLTLAAMWGAIIGSNATLLGGARGPLALALLQETTGAEITFAGWMAATLPIVTVMAGIAAAILLLITPGELDIQSSRTLLAERVRQAGPLTGREKGVAVVMVITFIAWFTLGSRLGIANIALLSVVVLFIFRLTDWRETEENVNWGVILMYGGAVALGYALSETGVSAWLMGLATWMVTGTFAFLAALCILSTLLTECMSNTAVVAFLLPLALSASPVFDAAPALLALVVPVASGFAFTLPMSTPAVAIALSTGYVSTRDTLRYGIALNISGVLLTLLAMRWYWPLLLGGTAP